MESNHQFASEEVKHLKHIEQELGEIKERTSNPRRSFFTGIFSGMGAIVGSLIALGALGWVLSILGVIPGLSALAHYFQGFVGTVNSRY